eukprot:CAMPEP_0116548124 /NCGR_PEP_ID=MMETSP0397-20121206/4151_1 /TAXON_ID=216820 /ORGANISM="Cyclophora tenuis, Strain ECT3854" /LENGTH=244 /DNA_ID=CAMNT_0004072717 /DNA_START=54 /DNA_END=785 /DNA_ORIENTATION=-
MLQQQMVAMSSGDVTCADFRTSQELLFADDNECTVGQAQAWRFCGCPMLPSAAVNNTGTVAASSCTFCQDDRDPLPTTNIDTCRNDATYLAIVGSARPEQCASLVRDMSTVCECPSDYYLTILNTVLDLEPNPEEFRTLQSPRYQTINWLAYNDPIMTNLTNTSIIRERYAAALLYFSLDGPNWTNGGSSQLNFLTGSSICEWNDPLTNSGIMCDSDAVVAIEIAGYNLLGSLPKELLAFSNLR